MRTSLDSVVKTPSAPQTLLVRSVSIHSAHVPVSAPLHTNKVRSIFTTLLFFLLIGAGLGLFSISRTQQLFTIISGSMEPTIPTGSVISITPVYAEQLEIGDVIAFRAKQTVITHRIIERTVTEDGLMFTTQGDANPTADPEPVFAGNILGRQTFTLPYLGYGIAWLRTLPGFALGILLPATLIILHEVQRFLLAWRTLSAPRLQATALGSIAAAILLISTPLTHALLTTNPASALNNTISVAAVFPTPSPSPSPTPEPTVEPTPSPSPTPPPSDDECDNDITVNSSNTNTGPGSINENTTTINTSCTHTETTTTDISNDIDIDVNTGGNEVSENTEGGNITSGDVEISFDIHN